MPSIAIVICSVRRPRGVLVVHGRLRNSTELRATTETGERVPSGLSIRLF